MSRSLHRLRRSPYALQAQPHIPWRASRWRARPAERLSLPLLLSCIMFIFFLFCFANGWSSLGRARPRKTTSKAPRLHHSPSLRVTKLLFDFTNVSLQTSRGSKSFSPPELARGGTRGIGSCWGCGRDGVLKVNPALGEFKPKRPEGRDGTSSRIARVLSPISFPYDSGLILNVAPTCLNVRTQMRCPLLPSCCA